MKSSYPIRLFFASKNNANHLSTHPYDYGFLLNPYLFFNFRNCTDAQEDSRFYISSKKLISYKNFHIVIKTIINENHFNIEEYQDKYYFKKKLQECFPQFTDEIIFSAIETYNKNNSSFIRGQKSLQTLSERLYNGVLSRYEGRTA